MPIIISAPHGGRLEPSELPTRSCGTPPIRADESRRIHLRTNHADASRVGQPCLRKLGQCHGP